MTPRVWVESNLSTADELCLDEKYLNAYYIYKEIIQYAADPDIRLYAEAQMLICQHESFSMRANNFLAQAAVFKKKLLSAIERQSEAKIMLGMSLFTIESIEKYLNINMGLNRLMHFKNCAEEAVNLIREEALEMYAELIGLDESVPTYQVDYLNDFYKEMLKVDKKNSTLLADLSETMGYGYMDLAEKTVSNDKKAFFRLAVEKYEQARKHWQAIKVKDADMLLLSILKAWERFHDYSDDNGEIVEALISAKKIIYSGEFQKLLRTVGVAQRESVQEDMNAHCAWLNNELADLTPIQKAMMEAREMPPPPKRKLEESADSESLPSDTFSATKKQRLGDSIFAFPSKNGREKENNHGCANKKSI